MGRSVAVPLSVHMKRLAGSVPKGGFPNKPGCRLARSLSQTSAKRRCEGANELALPLGSRVAAPEIAALVAAE
jgi:hypothetical protein